MKLKEFFQTLKPILIFSFLINIILLIYVYNIKSAQHIYLFSGSDEYISVNNGLINLNYDFNLLNGNNLSVVTEEKIEISELKIGYYVLENKKLNEIIAYDKTYEYEKILLKDAIDSIKELIINDNPKNLLNYDLETIEKELYFVLEFKTIDNEVITSKIHLDTIKLK